MTKKEIIEALQNTLHDGDVYSLTHTDEPSTYAPVVKVTKVESTNIRTHKGILYNVVVIS